MTVFSTDDLTMHLITGAVLVVTTMPGSTPLYALWTAFPDGTFINYVHGIDGKACLDDCERVGWEYRGSATLTAYKLKEEKRR